MPDCIFCQIVSGTTSAYKIYEDANYLAFLDAQPHCYGHTLIIPKTHYPHIWDMEHPGDLLNVTQKLVHHYQSILTAPDYFISVWGRKVAHAHLHLLPQLPTSDDLSTIAQRLRLT